VGKIRRGGFIFYTWKGDHAPRHVHVLWAGKPILKWDLDGQRLMAGTASKKLLDLIRQLEAEGRL
jgi:hypothetical protein